MNNLEKTMDYKGISFSAGVALLFVLANILTKKSLDAGWEWLMIVVSFLVVGAFMTFRAVCKSFGLAVASGVVDSLMMIFTIAIAIVVFKESLTAKQYAGLALLVIGLQLVR